MSLNNPPQIMPGMATVWLDPSGSLLRLQVVPPERDEPPAAGAAPPTPMDWGRLIAASGLREADLRPSAPAWNPPFHADERKAWTVPAAGGEGDLRVEAASYHGRPILFRIIGPWERPAESASDPLTPAQRAGQTVVVVMVLSILLASFLIARRNIRLG